MAICSQQKQSNSGFQWYAKAYSQEATKYAAQSETEPFVWLAVLEQGSVVETGDEDTSVSAIESGMVDSQFVL